MCRVTTRTAIDIFPIVCLLLLLYHAKNNLMQHKRICCFWVEAELRSNFSNMFQFNEYNMAIDGLLSFRSVKHIGFTRLRYVPHPRGDLVTRARNWCFIDRNGMGLISIPEDQGKRNSVSSHRNYSAYLL